MLELTTKQLSQIESNYENLPLKLRNHMEIPQDCSVEEKLCLKFLLSHLSASDYASYPIEFYRKSARDALSALAMLPWGETIPAEYFLNYILPPRINNEDLSDCRTPFFSELYPRVKALSMVDAVIEVNYWCLEKASYRSTDIRTNSPLSVVRSGYGRCGEESTLCVAAMRSVGIPARQCYTPRWAHCDDNHAWVEVWTGDGWHYIGACEPEPGLDRGWYKEPASRAMLIHARAFSNIVSEEALTQTPVISELNLLERYAKVKKLTVNIVDGNGNPVRGVKVRFELVNFAELYPITTLYTGDGGTVCFDTGYGMLMVHVSIDGRFKCALAKRADTELSFNTSEFITHESEPFTLDMLPPVSIGVGEDTLTAEQEKRHEERMTAANSVRNAYMDTFLIGDTAHTFATGFASHQAEIAELIAHSSGNHSEIAQFLKDSNEEELHLRVLLLKSLRQKDLEDSTCELLTRHFVEAYQFKGNYTEDIFVPYILCPWAAFELITDYRSAITAAFSAEQRSEFIKAPIELWSWIQKEIEDCGNREYSTLYANPVGLLALRFGSDQSRRTLFVSICRSLGIPARLSQLDGIPEYWRADSGSDDSKWHSVEKREENEGNKSCKLRLISASGELLEYEKAVTLSRLENGSFRTLGLEVGVGESEVPSFKLEPGFYRVTTSNRLGDGAVLAEVIPFELKPNEEKELVITLRVPTEAGDSAVELPKLSVTTVNGNVVEIGSLLPRDSKNVIAFLQVGAEPTEHLLNEILEQVEQFAELSSRIIFLLPDEVSLQNPLLKKTLEKTDIPYAYQLGENQVATMLEALSSQNKRLPLVMGLNELGDCLFHLSGYNVGTGEQLLKHIKAVR